MVSTTSKSITSDAAHLGDFNGLINVSSFGRNSIHPDSKSARLRDFSASSFGRIQYTNNSIHCHSKGSMKMSDSSVI